MKTLLLILLTCTAMPGLAQKNKPFVLDVKEFEPTEKIAIPFSNIKVIDARFDRSNVGCVYKISQYFLELKDKKVLAVFPDSFSIYFPVLLQKFLTVDNNSTDTLLILVKQFRMVDHLYNVMTGKLLPELLAKLSISFFKLKNNECSKLFSIDDLFSQKWKAGLDLDIYIKDMEIYRNEALMHILYTAFSQRQWKTNGVTFSSLLITDALNKRFKLPVFTDSILNVGLYKTFKEFKENRPSITNIKMKFGFDLLSSVKDSTDKPIVLNNYWGACDGKKKYIFFANHLCRLVPSHKSFIFLSHLNLSDFENSKDYTPSSSFMRYLAYQDLFNKQSNKKSPTGPPKYKELFYLNMDDEKVYLEEVFGKSSLWGQQKK